MKLPKVYYCKLLYCSFLAKIILKRADHDGAFWDKTCCPSGSKGLQLDVVAINAGSDALASYAFWRDAGQLLRRACREKIRSL